MLKIPKDLEQSYNELLKQKRIDTQYQPHYKKWLRYYLDFCHKYAFDPTNLKSFPAFNDKLKSKNQSEQLLQQAYQAMFRLNNNE